MAEKLKEVMIVGKRGPKLSYELDEFKRIYEKLKQPGVSDADIAKKLVVDPHTIYLLKKRVGIKTKKVNFCGITEEQLNIAEQNGIKRYAVFHRIREYGWTIERAITQPLGKRFEHF